MSSLDGSIGTGWPGVWLKYVVFSVFLLAISIGSGAASSGAAASAGDSNDVATKVICNVIVFVQKLGLPIMTGVILGSSIMAIFGKLAWPAIVMLVVFTAIFFGAGKLMAKFAKGVGGDIANGSDTFECKGNGMTGGAAAAAAAA